MESLEATKIVYRKIRALEPESVAFKIIGYILLHDHADRDMIRLAFGPDNLIRSLIQKAKLALEIVSKELVSPPISPSIKSDSRPDLPFQLVVSSRPFRPQLPVGFPSEFWDPHHAAEQQPMPNLDFTPLSGSDFNSEDCRFQNQLQFVGPQEDELDSIYSGLYPSDHYYPEDALGTLSNRGNRHSRGLTEFPVKACHYFNKGFCKHGSNCRYFHGQSISESYPNMLGPYSVEVGDEDQLFLPGSLEKLEVEITELLKSRRGNPVSIASLPMLYYEKYRRTLQAEGYLTESQRNGKAGFSLTKLLARLGNSILVIDRPHGQHSVILVEDAPKYMDIRGERNDPGPIVSGSRQIYLTFPAESTFTEDDVAEYFNTFGPVEDVRIPCQQRRMFGFVTFVSANTVKIILSQGNPHYVCGARVLVKPYREKPKLIDRKSFEIIEPPMYYHWHHPDMDCELHANNTESPSTERAKYLPGVLNKSAESDFNWNHTGTNQSEQESSHRYNLPDSPFGSQ